MESFDGKSLVVTGASGNLGRAICEVLLARGARVVGVVRKEAEAAPLAASIGAVGRFAAAVTELGDEAGVERAFEAAAALSPLWGLVNAAGAWDGGKPAAEAPLSLFDRMVDANLRSAYVTARAAMGRLLRAGGGRIVLVASYTAFTGVGNAGSAAYAASKAGVIGLTRALAEEGAASGVRTNCLAPGTIHTPANEKAMPGADTSRWVPLAQVAEAAAALAAPGPLAVNGAVVTLPGR